MNAKNKIWLLTIIIVIVCTIIVGILGKNKSEEFTFITYHKTMEIKDNNYVLNPWQVGIRVNDEVRPQYHFSFIDGSHGFFTTGVITNPIMLKVLYPGFYNVTYSNQLFGDYPILIDICIEMRA